MRLIKKEIYWLLGTIFTVLILNTLFFGFNGFKSESVIDINVHDTYYVISNLDVLLLMFVGVHFIIYLIRVLNNKFKTVAANVMLMISIIALFVVIKGINSILELFMVQNSGWTINPPLSTDGIEHEIESKENRFDLYVNLLFYTQVLLMIFLAFIGFKTGQKYKKEKHKKAQSID